MKRKTISLILSVTILSLLSFAVPVSAQITLDIGNYVQMGTYYGSPILWRCVANDTNGKLMISDRVLCVKAFDAKGTVTTGSHGRGGGDNGVSRQADGSNYWGDSNMRDWLNSTSSRVTWTCGNKPDTDHVYYGENPYDTEAGFLSGFTVSERKLIKNTTQKTVLDQYEYSQTAETNPFEITDSGTIDKVLTEKVISGYDTAHGENTTDKIFLPDVKQIYEIYKNNYKITGAANIYYYKAMPTEECVKNSKCAYYIPNVKSAYRYWLRTPNCKGNGGYEYRINSDRTIESDQVDMDETGVRPAFYINTDDFTAASGDGTSASPYIPAEVNTPDVTAAVKNIEGNNVTVTFTNETSANITGTYYVATYNSAGSLGSVGDPTALIIDPGDKSVNVTANMSSTQVKIFYWDENMMPICEAISVK